MFFRHVVCRRSGAQSSTRDTGHGTRDTLPRWDGASCDSVQLGTAGVGNVGGTRLMGNVNHLELCWHPAARDQVLSWLG